MADAGIIWQGNSSAGFGFVLDEVPSMVLPARRYTESYIAGANKALISSQGYSAFDVTVKLTQRVRFQADDVLLEKLVGDFLSLPAGPEHIGKLIMPFRCGTPGAGPLVWYEAELLAQADYTDAYRRKHLELTFRCQPFARAVGENSADVYDPGEIAIFSTGVNNAEDFSSDSFAPGRKPCVYVYAHGVNAAPGYLGVTVCGQGDYEVIKWIEGPQTDPRPAGSAAGTFGKNYGGRRLVVPMNRVKTGLGLTDPVVVLDFENDNYYACEAVSGHELLTDGDASYYAPEKSAGSIVPYFADSPWFARKDYYWDGSAVVEKSFKFWHDVRLNDYRDYVIVYGSNSGGEMIGSAVNVIYKPRTRYLL